MTKEQMIVAIIVAIIGMIGASIGGGFAFAQFMIKRKDEKEINTVQKRIDDSIDKAMGRFIAQCGEIGDAQINKAKEEIRAEFEEGLKMRGDEGKERFKINSKAIEENTAQISRLTELVEDQIKKLDMFTDSMTSVNKVVTVTAKGQRNFTYDRLIMVTDKILKSGKMTIGDKTNLSQLYASWKDLNGEDPEMDTRYEECMKLTPILDE